MLRRLARFARGAWWSWRLRDIEGFGPAAWEQVQEERQAEWDALFYEYMPAREDMDGATYDPDHGWLPF
jgi:hypothetical protein